MTDTTDTKSVLRRRLIADRIAASAARPEAGERLGDHFAPNWRPRAGMVVAGYHPLPHEIDPGPLMASFAAAGAQLCLPVVQGRDRPLVFRCWRAGDTLEARAFGVKEPTDRAPETVPDLVLVPLVGVDRQGVRLGFGAGYYDRTLARLRKAGEVRVVGLAYPEQCVDRLPCEDHDQRLDALVTDEGWQAFA